MITGKQLQFAMCETNAKSFSHELSKYIKPKDIKLQEWLVDGVQGYLVKYVAWVLGLKSHIPEGWKPEKRKIEITPRQTVLGLTYDKVIENKVSGKEHPLYKHGGTAKEAEITADRIKREARNRKKIRAIIDLFGNDEKASIAAKCSVRTVGGWKLRRAKGVYIPRKYIGNLVDYATRHNINITKQELIDMLPGGEK